MSIIHSIAAVTVLLQLSNYAHATFEVCRLTHHFVVDSKSDVFLTRMYLTQQNTVEYSALDGVARKMTLVKEMPDDFEGSISFQLDGGSIHLENNPPYAMFGDDNQALPNTNFYGREMTFGTHSIDIVVYEEDNGVNEKCSYTMDFEIIEGDETFDQLPTGYVSGQTGCNDGYFHIESKSECNAAAVALNLQDQTATNVGNYKKSQRPHGCYMLTKDSGEKKLLFSNAGNYTAEMPDRLNLCRLTTSPTPAPVPSPTECIAAEHNVITQSGLVPAYQIRVGDKIRGIAGEDGTEQWCNVLSVTNPGMGYVQQGFTANHFMVSDAMDVTTNHRSGVSGPVSSIEVGLSNIMTDCEAAFTEDRQLFTPFSQKFCDIEDLSWWEYRSLFLAVMKIVQPENATIEYSNLMENKILTTDSNSELAHAWQVKMPSLCRDLIDCSQSATPDITACERLDLDVSDVIGRTLDPVDVLTLQQVYPFSQHVAGAGNQSALSTGAIIGIAASLVLVVALFGMTMYRRVKSRSQKASKVVSEQKVELKHVVLEDELPVEIQSTII